MGFNSTFKELIVEIKKTGRQAANVERIIIYSDA
jgi:hypothetical protein